MFHRLFRRLRRSARNWTTDVTRSDRNAVIQRIVTAAAAESKDRLNEKSEKSDLPRTATPPPQPSPLASQLLGQDVEPEPIESALIGQRAFEIWVRNGKPAGTASSDWVSAEAELRAERGGS